MDYSQVGNTSMQPKDQPGNIGFSIPQDQPPAYSSLLPPTEAIQSVHIIQPIHSTNVIYVVGQPKVGPDPTTMTCPHCRANITSMIHEEVTAKTHLLCLLLCFIGCWCCAPLVYCTDGCLSKKHSCPSCNQYLGTYD